LRYGFIVQRAENKKVERHSYCSYACTSGKFHHDCVLATFDWSHTPCG